MAAEADSPVMLDGSKADAATTTKTAASDKKDNSTNNNETTADNGEISEEELAKVNPYRAITTCIYFLILWL
jgi:hypothetical protein